MKKKLIAVLLCLVLTVSLASLTVLADGSTTVTIYATNDMHGTVEESDSSIGLPRVAALAARDDAILVDAGDATQGASFATLTLGADVIKVMNAAGYDVMAAGNHEFDYGTEVFFENSEAADFPILSANTTYNGSSLEGSTVISRSGYDIGFVGLTTSNTTAGPQPEIKKGLTVGDELEAAKREIAALAAKDVDAVILICHMGSDPNDVETTVQDVLAGLSDSEFALVAAVVDAHAHVVEDGIPYTRNGRTIPIVQAGRAMSNLSRLTLTFTADGVTAAGRSLSLEEVKAMEITDADALAASKAVEDVLASVKETQDAYLNGKLIENKEPVWGGNVYWDYVEDRIVETAYGDLVTDAFAAKGREYEEAADLDLPIVALENGGGISRPMLKGTVTRGNILDTFNHGNIVEIWTVTSAQLYTALEIGHTMTGQDETGRLERVKVSGSFLQVSGFKYTYDPAGEAGAKVTQVVLDNGTALTRDDAETKLLLVTTNYIAGFDSLKDGEKLTEVCGEDMAIQDWLKELTEDGTVPLDYPLTQNRILYANDKSPDTYEVSIPVINDEGQPVPGLAVQVSVDRGESVQAVTDDAGCVTLTVAKGPHSIAVEGCDTPVYVNNYSGSGTVTTKAGYCEFSFLMEVADPYEDVPAGSWSWPAITWAKANGILKASDGTSFGPGKAATRAEAVTWLWRLAGEKQVDFLMTFPDVSGDASYAEAVRWAASEGIVQGRESGFDPDAAVTREEMAVMIYRYEQAQGGGFTGSWMFLLDYPDALSVSSWADEAMHWCVMNGIMGGSDGLLLPHADATRAQVAAMLSRYAQVDR